MPSAPDHPSASPPVLDVERVDWTPAAHATLTVRVHGRWRAGSPPGGAIVLLVEEGGARRRFDALPADGGSPAGEGWSVAFAVPAPLRPSLAGGLALEAGGSEHALPGARPRPADALEPGTGEEGEVVDRAVLAERRARRAELLEDALTRRATEAEQAVGALEDHLHRLEERLVELTAERDDLSGRLAERERALQVTRADATEAEALRATLAGEQGRAVAAEARAAAAEDRAAVLEARVAALEEHAVGLERELAEAVEQLKAGREELGSGEAAAADRYAAAQAIAAARHRAAELESRLAAVEAERLAPPPASPPPVWAPGPPPGEGADALAAERERQQRAVREVADHVRGLREVADHVRGLRDELVSTMAEVRAELAGRPVAEPEDVTTVEPGAPVGELAGPSQPVTIAAAHEGSGGPAHVGAALSALAPAVDRARREAPRPPDERLVAGLGDAAQRLRAETPPIEERESAPQAPAVVEDRDGEEAAPARQPAGKVGASFPARVVAPEDRVENDWLARSIVDMAGEEPRRAGQLVVELLPSQRLTARRALTYDLTVQEVGAVRVHLDRGQARVERRTLPATATEEVALRIAGPAAALAPLAAGGARRRLRGARVEGSRWTLRRLLRTRRDPVSLAALARAGDQLDPGLMLTALARAVDPAWAQGTELSVAYHLTAEEPPETGEAGPATTATAATATAAAPGPDADVTWVVTASGEGSLHVRPDPMPRAWSSAPESVVADGGSAPAPAASPDPEAHPELTAGPFAQRATVHVPAPALTALVAREELPGGAAPTVEGDVDAVALLHAWFDRVQGLPVAD